jgi:hypothetical protein
VKEMLARKRKTMITRSYYHPEQELYMDTQLLSWDYTGKKPRSGECLEAIKRLYLHLYFNDQRAVDDRQSFHRLLDQLEQELRGGIRVPEHETAYAKYFEIKKPPNGVFSFATAKKPSQRKNKTTGILPCYPTISKIPSKPSKSIEQRYGGKSFWKPQRTLNLRRIPFPQKKTSKGSSLCNLYSAEFAFLSAESHEG